ncbi:MAG TPA: biotin/lipoyl-binding protein [Acidimicrobiia bacterium]|nr:biotin/lipoyl-binding protein [Acidimicrobiia bacterium]
MNKRTRTIVLYSTLAVAVVGAGGLAYGAIDSSGGSTAKTATRLVSASVGTVSQTVSASGTVQPATSLDLNFTNGGVLTAVNVKAGDKVKEGQVLATIDPAKAKVALETAQANLAAAQQKLDQAKNPPATPQDPAPTVDAVAVTQAKAGLNQAALNVSDAQKAVEATTLRAPAAGTISAVNFTVGQTVGGGGNSTSSSSSSSSTGNGSSSSSSRAFATLLDLDHMVVKVGFPEADAGKVAAGQPVTLTIDSLPGERLSGVVSSIDTVSTVVNNVVTYNAVVTFDSVPAGVKPGMTANVAVIAASRDNVISVPSAAISTVGGESTVTVRSDGKDETRPVVTGLKGDGTTEIASGLEAGEQVVMSVGVVSSSASNRTTTNQQNRTGTFGGGGGGAILGGGSVGGPGFGGR